MEELIRCEKVKKTFTVRDFLGINKRVVLAIDNVSMTVNKGVNTGIVGESGSGKTTLAKILLLLVRPDDGSVYYKGTNITKFSETELRFFRKNVRIIFQNPFKSLNPRANVERIIKEAMPEDERKTKKIADVLDAVGLPQNYKDRYPHQMSGGERQRVAIARAIAGNPECIIADEPTGNLDATTEVYILNLLDRLKKIFGLTYVFISHNLKIVEKMCEKIIVIYRGNIVEQGSISQVLKSPLHPYTCLLYNPVSIKTIETVDKTSLGCPFAYRCSFAKKICFEVKPQLKEKEKEHLVSCFLYE